MSIENFEATQVVVDEKSSTDKKTKLLFVVNVVMFVLILVLYGLFFFSKGSKESASPTPTGEPEKQVTSLKVGYINAEAFNEGFKLATKFRTDLEAEQKRLESDLARRQKTFQDEVQKFQRDATAGTVSADALQAKEAELGRRQQELGQLAETYHNRLAKREKDMMDEVMNVFQDFFERYNLTRGYDYILRYTPVFGMYYANDKHDITQEVLEMINAEFDSRNQ